MCDLEAQLTASWNQLYMYVDFWWGRKTGEPGEKPLKQRREPTQTQPTYGAWCGNRTRDTLVGSECSHHCAIPAPQQTNEKVTDVTVSYNLPDLQKHHSTAVCSFPKMKTGFSENEAYISTRETEQHLPSCHCLS